MTATFVVVGGDAAGMSAASKAKRDDPSLEVIVFEMGQWVSYGACGLPYYVKGEIESLDDLVSLTPEEFIDDRDIDLRLGHEVTAIDTADKTVTVEADGESFDQAYDTLLISTGARALEPPIDGMDLDGVFTLHSMHEGGAVRDFIETKDPDSVGLIGGGYIGLEMAEAFRGRGLHVELFEMLPHVLEPFGEVVAERVEEHLRDEAVDLHLETAVDAIRGDRGRVTAIEAGGEDYPVEMALVGTGIAPNAELAEAAGIELGETGAIATDEYGRTSAEDVFAAGDCAEATNVVTGRPDYVPLALTANRHGRAIGETVASGELTEVGPIAGTAVVKVFDLEVARTGVFDEALAAEADFDPVSVTIEAESRAHYYPGGKPIRIQLTADADSRRVLGAAMVGREGVAKRIDTVATALHAGMTVDEVEMLDLAYAPPFSPVWDPVLTAAKVLGSKVDTAQPVEADD